MKTDVFRGVENTKIVTPKVVATAKKYYNCPTVDGMELENEGGSGSRGSHWEKSILMNEFMTA
jgi:proprotein convertase subtilisin/kexin type 5